MSLDPAARLALFRTMLRIRRVQERIEADYLEDRMQTPVHLYIGQEAIASGVCAHLRPDDFISSNHRSHGHYLAKGGDLNALIAELHCKATGCAGGFGGSMHLIDQSVGHLGSSSIVGGGIPLGTGMALAAKLRGEDRVSAIFFGDGAADEGVLYESMNFAMLKRLPAIYILENNGWSVCSPTAARHAQPNVFHEGADPDLLFTARIDGNDPELVWTIAQRAVGRARAGLGPSFIECVTYRILGHAGCKAQDPKGYRDVCEIEEWQGKDPVLTYQAALLADGALDQSGLDALDAELAAEIETAFALALAAPHPTGADFAGKLFCE